MNRHSIQERRMKRLLSLGVGIFLSLSLQAQSLGLQQLGTLGGEISMNERLLLLQGMGSLSSTVIESDSTRLDQGMFLACDLTCSGIKTGVEAINEEEKYLRIFPNPAHTVVFIEGIDDKAFSFLLFTPTGQLLQEGSVKNEQISLESLSSGLYLLILHAKDSPSFYHRKIIKR